MGSRSLIAFVLLTASLLGGCRGDAPTPGDDQGRRALAAVEDLEAEVADLRASLEAYQDGAKTMRRRTERLNRRLTKLSKRLKSGISDLRAAVQAADGAADEAASDASAALARLAEVGKDVDVLTDRYEYHLRRYHGGG